MLVVGRGEEGGVLEETNDSEELIARVAALDIGKAELVCCIRVPGEGKGGRRLQEVRTYPTMTRSLLVLADRLRELGVTRVVMEATSDYWKSPVRHEVPRVRAEVEGLRLRSVAAGR
jgi:transposase